ncbi:hypothetical protein GQ44DRAFT_707073, partial [Phaeosphaeriaceae sp. PMI808]
MASKPFRTPRNNISQYLVYHLIRVRSYSRRPFNSLTMRFRRYDYTRSLSLSNTNHTPQNTVTSPEEPLRANMTRSPWQSYAYQKYRPDGSHEELVRMRAQLMKASNELDLERKKTANIRKLVEAEKEKAMETALAHMMMDLLHKQAEALDKKAKAGALIRALRYREARIKQNEIFLSEGQKQMYLSRNKVDEEDRYTMSDAYQDQKRRQMEIDAQEYAAELNDKYSIRMQELELREVAQQMREQQYKALMRSTMESEIKYEIMSTLEVGSMQAEEEARRQGFLEGYGARHDAEIALGKARKGEIPFNSPELEFLYDSAHPFNLFSISSQLIELERIKVTSGPNAKNQGLGRPIH